MIVFHLCRLSRSSRLRLLADLDDPAAMEAMWEACFWHETGRCRPECGWNSVWRILRKHEGIVSGCKVNRLFNGLCGERLPTIDLAHVDLTGCKQRPEQHRGGVGRRQNSLRL